MDSLEPRRRSRKERLKRFRENPYDPIECALTCHESRFITTEIEVGQIIDGIFFLRLAVQKTCTNAKTVEMVNGWIDYLIRTCRHYPCFSNVNFENPVTYFEAVKKMDGDMIEVFDVLLAKAQAVNEQGSGI